MTLSEATGLRGANVSRVFDHCSDSGSTVFTDVGHAYASVSDWMRAEDDPTGPKFSSGASMDREMILRSRACQDFAVQWDGKFASNLRGLRTLTVPVGLESKVCVQDDRITVGSLTDRTTFAFLNTTGILTGSTKFDVGAFAAVVKVTTTALNHAHSDPEYFACMDVRSGTNEAGPMLRILNGSSNSSMEVALNACRHHVRDQTQSMYSMDHTWSLSATESEDCTPSDTAPMGTWTRGA